MAKKSMPWGEILLVSLLGGFLVVGLAVACLWVYRWAWDSQALVSVTGDEEDLYGVIAFGIGAVVTAVALVMTTTKKLRSEIVSVSKKKPGSMRFEDRRRRWR